MGIGRTRRPDSSARITQEKNHHYVSVLVCPEVCPQGCPGAWPDLKICILLYMNIYFGISVHLHCDMLLPSAT